MFSPSKEGAALLDVVACGTGGLAELAFSEDNVSFALAKVPVGSGTFARAKFVLLHMSPGTLRILSECMW